MLPSSPASHALLHQLDALVKASCVQPEQCELQPLLTLLLQALKPLPLAQQLAIAGSVFDQLAGVVEARAHLLLAAWESWHGTQSPVVDLSGDADLFVQSQQLAVADLFMGGVRSPYPERQASGVRGSALADQRESESEGLGLSGLGLGAGALAITEGAVNDGTFAGEGASVQADAGLDLTPVNLEPLSEADVLDTIRALSYGENIPLWSSQVSEAMQGLTQQQRTQGQALPLLALQQSLQVPLVEVWLALLLGESGYQLTRPASGELADFGTWSEAFYSQSALQVSVVE